MHIYVPESARVTLLMTIVALPSTLTRTVGVRNRDGQVLAEIINLRPNKCVTISNHITVLIEIPSW